MTPNHILMTYDTYCVKTRAQWSKTISYCIIVKSAIVTPFKCVILHRQIGLYDTHVTFSGFNKNFGTNIVLNVTIIMFKKEYSQVG